MLGLTFKPNTDDMRDAPASTSSRCCARRAPTSRAYDPEGMEPARALLGDLIKSNPTRVRRAGADALVIVTEWDAFRALDLGGCQPRCASR